MIETSVAIKTEILEQFNALDQSHNLAHAYLFVGPEYVGKSETAVAIAKMVNCEGDKFSHENLACGTCPNCLKIAKGNHPDVHIVEAAAGEKIKIEMVRDLLAQIKLRPFMAKKKIFIIKNTDLFTLESGNALLKTLEEPSQNSLLILTTAVPENVLSTVKSRCHSVRFAPFQSEALAEILINQHGEGSQDAHFLAYFANGCLGKAIRLKENGILARKDEVIDKFILNRNSDDYVKKMLTDKIKTKEFLNVLLSWVRDAILIKSGVAEVNVIHRDRIKEVEQFQKNFTSEELHLCEEEIVQMFKMLAENFNIKIPLIIIKERIWAS